MKLPYCLPDQGHCVWPSSTWPWRQGQSLVPPVRDNTAHTVALSTTASPSKGPPPGTVAAHTDLSTNNTIIIFNGKKKHAILISQTLAPSEWHCETFQWNIKFHIVFTICMIRSSHLNILKFWNLSWKQICCVNNIWIGRLHDEYSKICDELPSMLFWMGVPVTHHLFTALSLRAISAVYKQ